MTVEESQPIVLLSQVSLSQELQIKMDKKYKWGYNIQT